jgi:hypothetical protein
VTEIASNGELVTIAETETSAAIWPREGTWSASGTDEENVTCDVCRGSWNDDVWVT